VNAHPSSSHPAHGLDHDLEDHDRGLTFDLATLVARRQILKMFGGAGLLVVAAGCGSDSKVSSASSAPATTAGTTPTSATATRAATTAGTLASCDPIPDESAGPFPGDGSNGPDVLEESGVVRRDIRSSFGSMSGTAAGVPLTVTLALVDTKNGCAPLAGAAVYLWHCDQEGRYSLYSNGATDQNYLRGVQVADANGQLTFETIYPGCYSGRWPHAHFEVYQNVDAIKDAGNASATSQLAFPKAVSESVYATDGYSASVRNLAGTSLASDGVFGDDQAVRQLVTVTGTVEGGLTATLTVPV